MMRKSLWIIALLFAAIFAPDVHAQTTEYLVTFGNGNGIAPTIVGSDIIDYDSSTDQFTTPSISVDWPSDDPPLAAATIVLSNEDASVSTSTLQSLYWECNTASSYLRCLINDDVGGLYLGETADSTTLSEFDEDFGPVTLTAVTPEPNTAVFWLTGIVLMIVGRKRLARLLRLDTGTHGSLSPQSPH
jgi:hypothetical protein